LIKYFLIVFVSVISIYASEKSQLFDGFEDVKDVEAKKAMTQWMDGNFGLIPHKVNYLLPYGYRFDDGKYKSYVRSDEYRRIEAELQISLKSQFGYNLFGLNERYYLAYSQKSFWQIYSKSSPFRETNYNPEGFVVFPIEDDSMFKLQSLEVGIAHMSNGQGNNEDVEYAPGEFNPGNRSRSVNYIYSVLSLRHDTLVTRLKVWIPYFGADLDDNPDLMDYTGFTEVDLSYFFGKNLVTFMARGNPVTGLGCAQVTASHPIMKDVYLYIKLFSGYTESLIDYDNYVNKFAIGFSFSR